MQAPTTKDSMIGPILSHSYSSEGSPVLHCKKWIFQKNVNMTWWNYLRICYFNQFLNEVTSAKCWLTNLFFESIHKHYS